MRYSELSRLPVDPRIVQDIMSSPTMYREQGQAFMTDYSGPVNYIAMSRMSVPERVTYGAVLDGFSITEDIVGVTGLSAKEVDTAISSLQKKGYISPV